MGRGWKPVKQTANQSEESQQESQELVELVDLSPTEATDDTDAQMAADDLSAYNESMAGTPAPASTPPVRQSTIPDLSNLIANLSPDQLNTIRRLSEANGIAVESKGSRTLPDGSLRVTVTLEPLIVEQLTMWADGDGLTVEEEAQTRLIESIRNFMFGDWSTTPEPAPAPVVAATK